MTALVSPQAAKIERAGFAVLGVVIKAIEDPNAAVGANGLNVSLDGQLVSALRTSPPVVKSAVPEATTEQ